MTLSATIEACLASVSRPLSLQALADLLDVSTKEVQRAIDQLELEYTLTSRGFALVRSKQSVQLLTHPQAGEAVQKLHQKDTEGDLSDVALETLAIVAYAGPISREAIEDIRGVNCVQIVRLLCKRGLLTKQSGEYTMYALSTDALRYLGLTSLEQLPDFEALRATISQHVTPESTTTETESVSS